jgi:DMSO/TMAO reductase YedYZ molybdopterin-dependent catalytic subunit
MAPTWPPPPDAARGQPAPSGSPRAAGVAGRLRRLRGGGVAGNRALVSTLAVVLLVLLLVQVASAVWFALLSYNLPVPAGPVFDVVRPVHFFVGFLLLPLIGLKLAAVGYRVARYYTRDAAYHVAGAPPPVMRLIAPLLVLSVVVLVASGVEMWSFRNDLGVPWITVHDLSAFAFVALVAVHVAGRLRIAARSAAAELRGRHSAAGAPDAEGRVTRRALLAGGTAAGLTLAVGAAQWPRVSLAFLAPRRAGPRPLDFPVMNYEGGGQQVDVARWRLRVTGDVIHPLVLTEAELLALPAEEHRYAINCVTGWTAERTWRGVAVARLLAMAGARDGFTHVQVRSTSGYHWDHHRSAVLATGAMIVTHIDGVRLDADHGHPARLMIPGVTGQSNVKWVDGLAVGTGAAEQYLAAHTQWGNQPVSGYFLPPDPAGRSR